MKNLTAAALVFGSSCAVLVVEIAALRLLAPYLGLTLETSTLVIGIALSAIALGSWVGGFMADEVDPRRTLAPLLAISGAVVALTPWLVRSVGESDSPDSVILAAAVSIVIPGALLSAVTPMVTKLMLNDLGETGTIVGRLSGIGTVGAIIGTIVTGFVLISQIRVSVILVGLGAVLVLAAVVLEVGRRGRLFGGLSVVAVAAAGATALAAPGGCELETKYHCASVVDDGDGQLLMLDGLRHSWVKPGDPTYLEFAYTQAYASVLDARWPAGQPLEAHHIGAGGVTMPRYLAATRPGTQSTVSEIDPGVVQIDRKQLDLETDDDLQVRIEDGRLGLRDLKPDSLDLVIGDAFGGVSVPWHLTTREAMADVDAALTDDGLYVVNVIDHGELAFARAAARTMTEQWEHVTVLSSPAAVNDGRGGNLVIAASHEPQPIDEYQSQLDERDFGWAAMDREAVAEFVDGATVLTDDFAPVDQLLTPEPPRVL